MLTSILKKRGWKLESTTMSAVGSRVESWSSGKLRQTLVVQQAPDARPETIRGRLSLAIVEAQRLAVADPSTAGIVVAPSLSRAIVDDLEKIANLAPGVGWGAVGEENGRVALHLSSLDISIEPNAAARRPRVEPAVADPFSDLGLWITKVLIKRTLSVANNDWNTWLTGPNTYFGTYEAFAEAVGVSTKTVWQTTHALDALRFVAGAAAATPLVRIDALLARMRGATQDADRRVPCRWLLPRRDSLERILDKRLTIEHGFHAGTRATWQGSGRLCLAGISAARAHGLSVTNVRLDEVHVDPGVSLEALGLVHVEPGEKPDLVLHRARRPESVFRAAVLRDGLPTADIVQTWLDVVDRPDRGSEQASRLWEAMLG